MNSDSPFEFSMGIVPDGALRVVSFRGRERLSKTYAFDILVAGQDLDEAKLAGEALGQPGCLWIHGPAGSRAVRGVVSRCASAGAHLHARTAWKVRLVPRLAMLKLRRNSRIFQDMTTPEILSAILDERKIAHRWETQQAYAARSYCVQYEESDLDFVHRLLAEVGMFYRFEHAGDGESADVSEEVVFGDRAHYAPIEGDAKLIYRHVQPGSTLTLGEHHVTEFHTARAAAPATVARRDHDFERPLSVLDAAASVPGSPGEGEVYEHHGEFAEAEAEQRLQGTALEQLRRKTSRSSGKSACPRLLVGRRFTLDEHELTSHDGDHLVTTIEHHGRSPEIIKDGGPTYENTFACVPANSVFRPARRPRQFRQVMETAVVTGPAGQEIYTDNHGRIKVQFHWDREGKRNEHSSCFMRVAQAWSGSGWGFQFVPRIGMEVLVSFLGGDPDRPMVVGCVPNATHPVPYALPENQHKSGIKTESTPGGGGFNELLFNDAKGGELVSIRAERNFTETVLNDHLQTVGHDQTTAVAGKRVAEVKGEDSLRVDGGQTWAIGGASSVSVGGGANAIYGGARSTGVVGDDTTRIGGGQTVMAAAYSHLLIGHGAPQGHGLVYVNGNYRIGAAGEVGVSAAKSLTLTCGDSSIELTPTEIKLKSPKITLLAAEELYAKGNEHEMAITDHLEIRGEDIRLFAKEGQLILDEDAKLNGKLVKLNCDKPKPEEKEIKENGDKGEIVFQLKPNFELVGDEALIAVIAGPDGKLIEKEADANREVRIEGVPGDSYVLVDIRHGARSLSKKNIG